MIPGFELDTARSNRIVVEDCNQCSGEWALYSLLETYLRGTSHNVVFVASQQFFQHYQVVLKKMAGINLKSCIESGQLAFIDAFSQPFSCDAFENLPVSTSVPNTFSLQPPAGINKFTASTPASSQDSMMQLACASLYTTIEEQVKRMKGREPEKPILVCIDNLSGMLTGLDSDFPDLDFQEALSSLL